MITSTANATVKAARKLAGRQGRSRSDAFLVEGPQAVREAVGALERLFVSPAAARAHTELVRRAAARGADVHDVSDAVLASLASTVTPQGLVGVARLPARDLADALGGFTVVLDRAADPGNAGAVVRTADAAGASGVVLTGHSVDVRNPKAVRASAGSLFHLPVVTVAFDELAAACRARGVVLVAADARGQRDHTDVDLTVPTAVVFGNEAHGLDEAVRSACDIVAAVPIHGQAESLNLAATVAVFAYEAARQRIARGAAGSGILEP